MKKWIHAYVNVISRVYCTLLWLDWRANNSNQLCHKAGPLLVTLRFPVSWHSLEEEAAVLRFTSKRFSPQCTVGSASLVNVCFPDKPFQTSLHYGVGNSGVCFCRTPKWSLCEWCVSLCGLYVSVIYNNTIIQQSLQKHCWNFGGT